MAYRLFGLFLLFFSPVTLWASDVMFEGYYRITLAGKPVGYDIYRYAFDPKTQNFEVTYFVYAKIGDAILQESVKGKADNRFRPISYSYTSQAGDKLKMIDATFKGQIMQIRINDNKEIKNQTHKIPKGTFLSSFLPYMMLQHKLDLNVAFTYYGVAEEDGNTYTGKAWFQSKEARPGYEIYHVVNSFKAEKFISEMAVIKDEKDPSKNVVGEVIATETPAKKVSAQLMAANVATEGQTLPNKILLALFGNIPAGKNNLVVTPPPPPKKGPPAMIPTPVPADEKDKKGP